MRATQGSEEDPNWARTILFITLAKDSSGTLFPGAETLPLPRGSFPRPASNALAAPNAPLEGTAHAPGRRQKQNLRGVQSQQGHPWLGSQQ